MKRRSRLIFMNLAIGAVAALVLWIVLGNLDWHDPWVTLKPEVAVIGAKADFVVEAGDKDWGVKSVRVTVHQGGQEKEVLNRSFPAPGWFGAKEARVAKVDVPFSLDTQALGLKEGKATLMIKVHDRSWRNQFKGREAELSRELVLDLVPVKLTFLSVNHLLHSGGTGVICYRLNKNAKESGVFTGGRLYLGYPNPKGAAGEYISLFPLSREGAGTQQVELLARPEMGTETRQKVSIQVKPRRWRSDKMNLSEDFLRQMASRFKVSNPGDPLSAYLEVNRELRRQNHERVRQACALSNPQPLWSGAFQRFLGKPMARFGDRRAYMYQGRQVDQQVHLGEDLASLEHSPVPAGHNGIAVMAEDLGIYGQTVILDHGLGVFSMYSHLSRIDVKTGEQVAKGAAVGRTGATGLAGGDHLHFAMILQGDFVDPVEWWDPHWHKDQMEGQWVRAGAPQAQPAKTAKPAKAAKGKAKAAKGKKPR